MKKSRRHHYVPQFFIKGFSTVEDRIFVFNKIENKFYTANPTNLFIEKDRNTFKNSDGKEDDVIERVYSTLDSFFANVLTEITSTEKVSNDNYKLLLFLAYIIKWRVPQYDESFNEVKQHFSVGDLGLGLRDVNRQIEDDFEEFFELDMQQELKRLLVAIQPFRFKADFKKLLKHSFLISTPFPSFIGDCPFVEATFHENELFEDFIFPVTKDLTLVYSPRIDRDELVDFLLNGDTKKVEIFQKDFSIARDVSLLDITERNIACCDLDYLKHVVGKYNMFKMSGSSTPFYLTIFNVLYRVKEYVNK